MFELQKAVLLLRLHERKVQSFPGIIKRYFVIFILASWLQLALFLVKSDTITLELAVVHVGHLTLCPGDMLLCNFSITAFLRSADQ